MDGEINMTYYSDPETGAAVCLVPKGSMPIVETKNKKTGVADMDEVLKRLNMILTVLETLDERL